MSAELLINVTPQETRAAFIENGVLQELLVERASSRGIVGNVYKGRVSRVLPGMQAAFIDIGLERAAFLHASDISSSALLTADPTPEEATIDHRRWEAARRSAANGDSPASSGSGPSNGGTGNGGGNGHGAMAHEPITRLVHEGQEMLVQVIKDPIGTKGARLTTNISIPACFLVFLPDGTGVGVSQRIEDETSRESLRDQVSTLLANHEASGGYIVRTAAECAQPGQLDADIAFLAKLWGTIGARAQLVRAPALVHEDLPLLLRTLREMVGIEIDRIRVDSRESHRRVVAFTDEFIPELSTRVEHYRASGPSSTSTA